MALRHFFALILGLVLYGTRAWAGPPTVHLIYAADDPSCPDEAAIRRGVTERLGFDPFVEQATPESSTLTATLRRDERGVVARIELADPLGDVVGLRKLRARPGGCAGLAPSVVLAITIAVDPLALLPRRAPPAPEPVVMGPPLPEAEVLPALRRRAVPPPPPIPRTVMVGLAGILISIAPKPTTALGFFAELFVRQRHWSLGIGFRGDLPAPFSEGYGLLEVSLLAGELMICGHFFSLYACPIAIVGEQRARSRPASNDGAAALFAAIGGRLGLIVPLSRRLELQLRLDLLANVTGPVTLNGFQPSPGSAALVTGLGGRFW